MKAEEVMAILTDGTVNQWQEFAHNYERLTRELAEANQDVANMAEALKLKNDMDEEAARVFHAERDRLTAEVADVTARYVRTHNQLAMIAEHMPEIVADWLASISLIRDEALTDEYRLKRKHATELLRLLEPFAP